MYPCLSLMCFLLLKKKRKKKTYLVEKTENQPKRSNLPVPVAILLCFWSTVWCARRAAWQGTLQREPARRLHSVGGQRRLRYSGYISRGPEIEELTRGTVRKLHETSELSRHSSGPSFYNEGGDEQSKAEKQIYYSFIKS